MDIKELAKKLSKYDGCNLECDGFTRVAHTLLTNWNIGHTVKMGRVAYQSDVIRLHYWIILSNGMTVDYRLRMWLGNDGYVPHGIFNASDYGQIIYDDELTVNMPTLNTIMFDILTTGC